MPIFASNAWAVDAFVGIASFKEAINDVPAPALTLLFIRLILLLGLGCSAYIAVIDRCMLVAVPEDLGVRDDARDLFRDMLHWAPWGGFWLHEAVRAVGKVGPERPELAEEVLAVAAVRRPIDGRLWLDRARVAPRLSARSDHLQDHLEAAEAAQPHHRALGWRRVMMAVQAGHWGYAESQLSRWLTGHPEDTGKALFVARQWHTDPNALIDAVLPDSEAHQLAALRHARLNSLADLSDALWRRHVGPVDPENPALLERTELLLETGSAANAARLWATVDPKFARSGVANAQFSRALGSPLALNWRISRGEGYDVTRDEAVFRDAPASLMFAFHGTKNVQFSAWQWLVVESGKGFRLTGWWRAERLTTRALPVLRIWAPRHGTLVRHEVPSQTFGWKEFSIEFNVPQDTQRVRLQVERRATHNFDRKIAGRLWLDTLSLERLR